jgi:catechol 2,3-dioxygenase-like lactoylglutathione lyase family enzyme
MLSAKMVRMIDHLSIQCGDVTASAAFYDTVLAPLGGTRVMDFGDVIGFGIPPQPDFWIGPRATGEGFRESHIAFTPPGRTAVRAFFGAAWHNSRTSCPRRHIRFRVGRLPEVPPPAEAGANCGRCQRCGAPGRRRR